MCLLCTFMISFIFINSSFDAVSSSAQSLGVREFINSLFKSIHINITLTEHLVRKCAHFVEYFLLGIIFFYTVLSFVRHLDFKMIFALVFGLVVAAIDESIQLFSSGRSAQVSDVLLDFTGVLASVAVLSILTLIVKNIRKDKEV